LCNLHTNQVIVFLRLKNNYLGFENFSYQILVLLNLHEKQRRHGLIGVQARKKPDHPWFGLRSLWETAVLSGDRRAFVAQAVIDTIESVLGFHPHALTRTRTEDEAQTFEVVLTFAEATMLQLVPCSHYLATITCHDLDQ